MFLPFDTSMSVWYALIPRYEWVPAAPPEPPPDGNPDAPGAGGCEDGAPAPQPPLRLVFQGFEWMGYRLWSARPNASWDLCADNRREEDERRCEGKQRRTPGVSASAVLGAVSPGRDPGAPGGPEDAAE